VNFNAFDNLYNGDLFQFGEVVYYFLIFSLEVSADSIELALSVAKG